MPNRNTDNGLSGLEREFELAMEDEPEEYEESADDMEDVEEPSASELADEDSEDDAEPPSRYAERFYEMSLREFESESEVDDAIDGLLSEMERDYFLKGLWKKIKKGGKWLLKKGVKLAKGLPVFQAVKGITQLARGNLKGLLGSLAKAGLGAAVSAIPGGAAVLPALKAIGFESTDDPEANRPAWNNYVAVCREAYDYLARNLHERADDPVEASRLAASAFRSGLDRVQSRTSGASRRGYRVIRVRAGEKILIQGI
jgi:hypothetical protein